MDGYRRMIEEKGVGGDRRETGGGVIELKRVTARCYLCLRGSVTSHGMQNSACILPDSDRDKTRAPR